MLSDLREEVLEPEPVSVLEILNDTAARMREQAAGISVQVRGTDSVIPGDRELLSLLCDNLCANAIHASQPGMTVSLVAESCGFTVEDEGTGMMPANLSGKQTKPGLAGTAGQAWASASASALRNFTGAGFSLIPLPGKEPGSPLPLPYSFLMTPLHPLWHDLTVS